MKCVSLYSGADNLGDGVIQAGHDIILCVEKDKDCCETIHLNHPDIEVINGTVSEHLESLPRADCVIGGPPCPEFSPAKHNKTFDLCEVNNFNRATEICKATHHFMENVPLMTKVYKERNFLINAADYGVPQTRERRIFTDLELPKRTHGEFPSESLFGEPVKKWISIKDALGLDGYVEDRKTKYFGEPEFRKYPTNEPSHTLITDSREWYISNSGHNTRNREYITRSIDEPADTITIASTMQLTTYQIKSRKKIRNRNQTLKGEARPLVNEELATLQGFRPDFKFYGGITSVKAQIGNALPSVVSRAFFQLVL